MMWRKVLTCLMGPSMFAKHIEHSGWMRPLAALELNGFFVSSQQEQASSTHATSSADHFSTTLHGSHHAVAASLSCFLPLTSRDDFYKQMAPKS